MYLIISTIMIIIIILMVFISMIIFLMKKSVVTQENSSPFECGFDPLSSTRVPFSLQFFLIGILFLIFDVEISLILPVIFTLMAHPYFQWSFIIFMMILLLGLLHEWKMGSLEWLN